MDVSDLKKTALIYWPVELAEKEKLSSIIPLLIRTQESFISILRIASIAVCSRMKYSVTSYKPC